MTVRVSVVKDKLYINRELYKGPGAVFETVHAEDHKMSYTGAATQERPTLGGSRDAKGLRYDSSPNSGE